MSSVLIMYANSESEKFYVAYICILLFSEVGFYDFVELSLRTVKLHPSVHPLNRYPLIVFGEFILQINLLVVNSGSEDT